jgi:heme/copper-type cytochrome/quinol oxidase subunit 4
MSATAADLAHDHSHPGPAVYIKIGVILFILTAAEVAVYELGYHHAEAGVGALLHPIVVPVLLVLSAVKFALVAMFYMHLKQDSKLFTGVFVFPLIIATVVIIILIVLFAYLHSLHPGGA